ncbi:hypothetical protein BDV37DRAFT_246487 [Aspergillus pseudonomiae]|uniref:Uncharacterized protein n=1 Tax=Aspergillus pseudonomiae TaxID=1506151 RepID=A0A5N7DEN0_9EURO|nr:uncharacterized protein BDV37DRAFT_246487 [Aspergillus pseudonomiae]KAE8404872.1 hypothetical protein BDV37DRAFT_246487 [Aspergillus pseudonomiae]
MIQSIPEYIPGFVVYEADSSRIKCLLSCHILESVAGQIERRDTHTLSPSLPSCACVCVCVCG